MIAEVAAREYASRPADERYASVAELVAAARHDREYSKEVTYNLRDLRAVSSARPGDPNLQPVASVQLQSPKGSAGFTHWSFGQLCRQLGAPAAYLRELPADLAADCLNHGIRSATVGQTASLLVQAPNGRPAPTIRACTSDSYGRLWDGELYAAVQDYIIARDPSWECQLATRSDRDSYLTITNKRAALQDPSVAHIVNDPAADVGGIMYRSLTIGNSEVGARSLWIDGGLWRARCKNLMLWSASTESSFRRRHVGTKVVRDAIREISRFAVRFVQQSAARDEAIIRGLIDRELASTKDAVIDELQVIGASREAAEAAYARCEETEAASPRSFWGAAQGITRISQDSAYQDERIELDRLAAKVLARGARLVAA